MADDRVQVVGDGRASSSPGRTSALNGAGSTRATGVVRGAALLPPRWSDERPVDRRFYRRRYDAQRRSKRSPPDCATRSTSTRSRASSPPSCGERWNPLRCRSGSESRRSSDEPAGDDPSGLGRLCDRHRAGVRRARFLILNRSTPGVEQLRIVTLGDALFGVVVLTFPTVGALIASRRPRESDRLDLRRPGKPVRARCFRQPVRPLRAADQARLPSGRRDDGLAAVVALSAPLFLAATLLFLLFPEGGCCRGAGGRSSGSRSAPSCSHSLGEMFSPHALEDFEHSAESIRSRRRCRRRTGERREHRLHPHARRGILVSATSLVLRFRRASGLERQQLKWVASAAGLLGAAFASGPLLFWYIDDAAWEPMLLLAVATIPVSAGFAILRYRLYEIDRIVNRAVVYAAVSALLVGVYFGIVLGLQEVFSSFGGGSDLAIADLDARRRRPLPPAASASSARSRPALLPPPLRRPAHPRSLLRPTARRDRHPALHGELTAVVRRTLEPERVSLWLRPAVTDAVTPRGRSWRYNEEQSDDTSDPHLPPHAAARCPRYRRTRRRDLAVAHACGARRGARSRHRCERPARRVLREHLRRHRRGGARARVPCARRAEKRRE